ncbi:hypothetical protein BDN71DRAFT_1350299, partial [Pleurotus eryngii]
FIKDINSSNGTFINGDRLSPEGMEFDPWELQSDDIVCGANSVPTLSVTTRYSTAVAARVFCMFNGQDLQIAYRSE